MTESEIETTQGAVQMVKDEWHVDKSVSVGHLLTTVLIIASAVAAFYSLSSRLDIVESRIILLLENQVNIDLRQDDTLEVFRDNMQETTSEINSKLDIVLETLLTK